MGFDAAAYGPDVLEILALDGRGERLMPLAGGRCSSESARARLSTVTPSELFPAARAPEAAYSGLWLYFSCYDEAHRVAQDLQTPDGSVWHAILHRREPDPGNAAYWFRRVGRHPVFEALRARTDELQGHRKLIETAAGWDPLGFVDFCEEARRKPGSAEERLALEVQRAEWQLLFDWCAGRAG